MKFFTKKDGKEKKSKPESKEETAKVIEVTPEETIENADEKVSEVITDQLIESVSGDEDAKRIIEIISNTKDGTLHPSINFEENKITYPQIAEITSVNVIEKLDELAASSDVLEKKIYERIPVCPEHSGSISTSVRLYCSSCLSDNIKKLHLIEHKVCGYITEDKIFQSSGNKTICISCKKPIKNPDKEIRKLGRWYECDNCNTKFDNCVVKLHCRKYEHDFTVSQADMQNIYYYKIKADSASLHSYAHSILSPLKKSITSKDFIVDTAESQTGKSGVSHKISLFAKNNSDQSILIDIKGEENQVNDSEINAFMLKIMDIAPTISIFVAIPSVSNNAKSIAKTYNLSLVTGNDFNKIIGDVEKIIQEKLSSGKFQSMVRK